MRPDHQKTQLELIQELQSLRKKVAELERRQAAAARQEGALSRINAASPDLNFIYDLDGRYLDVLENQRKLIVYPRMGELRGSMVGNVLPGEVATVMLDAIRRCVDAPEFVTIEYQLEVPAGIRWFEGRLAPIKEGRTRPQRVLLVSRDITERKEIELAQANLISELQREATRVQHLPDIIPVCSFCHRIRDEQGQWHDMAAYFLRHFKLGMSHGVCKDCMHEHYPNIVL